jgi:hypothetical protein
MYFTRTLQELYKKIIEMIKFGLHIEYKDCSSKIGTRFASSYLQFGLANLSAFWIWYTPIDIV